MKTKFLGSVLIVVSVVIIVVLLTLNQHIQESAEESCSCTEMQETGYCPHQERGPWQTYLGVGLVAALAALGAYLIFFERSQQEITAALSQHNRLKSDQEKFAILLKGLSPEEQRVITAVKEQDGITQQTLRLRTDLHKSKLSMVLDGLEKKGLVKRVAKGKTKQVFLKIHL